MMGMVDLMPKSCRDQLGQRSRVRRWLMAYVGGGGLLVALWAWVGVDHNSLAAEREHRIADVQRRWDQDEEVQRLLVEMQEVEAAVTRYNSLAWPVRLSSVLDGIGSAVPDRLTLTSLMATPRETQARRGGASTGLDREYHLIIELEGIALDDRDVAKLVNGLDSNPLFESVTLDYTRSTFVDEVRGRSFRVTGDVDLLKRYSFVSPQRKTTGRRK